MLYSCLSVCLYVCLSILGVGIFSDGVTCVNIDHAGHMYSILPGHMMASRRKSWDF